jgi:archaemetzincin
VRSHARPDRLLLVALGGVGPRLVASVGSALHDALGLEATLGPALQRPQYAYNEARGQYHASAIVRRLAALGPAPVLGLADVDLFIPDAPWVLGDADRDAGAALVSVARIGTPDRRRIEHRARVEAVHEAGHLLGLGHCQDARCAMYLSTDPRDVDRKAAALCHTCSGALGLGA